MKGVIEILLEWSDLLLQFLSFSLLSTDNHDLDKKPLHDLMVYSPPPKPTHKEPPTAIQCELYALYDTDQFYQF
jgi:hypothetical protein